MLSREIERNPDDPGLYERLAVFLDQNRLGSQQEEIYRRAMARFSDKSWYDKLARFYLRHKRDSEFEQLTRDAVAKFQGSELEQYFSHVVGWQPGALPAAEPVCQPAASRTIRCLSAIYCLPTSRPRITIPPPGKRCCASIGLKTRRCGTGSSSFFRPAASWNRNSAPYARARPMTASWQKNPAAADFLAYADLWRSHFEESAPVLKALAAQYPAEAEIGHTASSVYRSLAYFEPADTAIAAKIEDNLLQANPGDTEIMARIGDIYADRELFAQAAPYWERIPQVAPGQSGGYLEAATIYWDYFDFDNALRLLGKGRDRLADASLYAYEAGAIYENQRDYPRAIDEYVKGALGAPESSAELRLLQLARRPKFRDLVDQSTAKIAAIAQCAHGLR